MPRVRGGGRALALLYTLGGEQINSGGYVSSSAFPDQLHPQAGTKGKNLVGSRQESFWRKGLPTPRILPGEPLRFISSRIRGRFRSAQPTGCRRKDRLPSWGVAEL